MKAPLPCLVSHDGRWTKVAELLLDAAAIEALIWELAACRAAMLPRRTGVLFSGSRINLGDALRVTTDAEGRRITAVMHPGLGWVGVADMIRQHAGVAQGGALASQRSHLASDGLGSAGRRPLR